MGFILAHPSASHALIASLEAVLGILALRLLGAPQPEILAAAVVIAIYYGREAGQREHDLKNQGWAPVRAWLGAALFFGWSTANVQQWVAPTIAALTVAAAFALTAG